MHLLLGQPQQNWIGRSVERFLEKHAALLLTAFIPGLNRPEENRVLFVKDRLQKPCAGIDQGIVEWRPGWV